MLNLIKTAAVKYNKMQLESFKELFHDNAEEVLFTSNVIQLTSTIQFVYDWKKKGFKKAMINNAIIAGGLVGYYIVKLPAVEKVITDKVESIITGK